MMILAEMMMIKLRRLVKVPQDKEWRNHLIGNILIGNILNCLDNFSFK